MCVLQVGEFVGFRPATVNGLTTTVPSGLKPTRTIDVPESVADDVFRYADDIRNDDTFVGITPNRVLDPDEKYRQALGIRDREFLIC